jgi:hypothetical protein
MDEIKILHEKKNNDYTTSGLYENFERMSQISSWFVTEIDKTFATMAAVKLARLASLLGRKKVVNNESVLDTFRDLTTYCGLWTAYYTDMIPCDNTYTHRISYVNQEDTKDYPHDACSKASPSNQLSDEPEYSPEYKKHIELSRIIQNLTDDKLAVLLSEARRLDAR